MAGTIIDYVKEYGDRTWEEFSMNDVDSLVLCQLAYLKFDGLVPGIRENKASVTLKDISIHADYEKLYADERYEKSNRALFESVLHSRRYANLRLNCYINIIEKEWETQFSAVTFLLEDGSLYIAYRGTDETIIGWKEDFNMAFLDQVPGQAYSVKYLNMVTGKLRNPLYLGGHSKGGNLAVYAAAFCAQEVQRRIDTVWCNDGPGFLPETLQSPGLSAVRDRIRSLLPRSSVVGVLLSHNWEITTVESSAVGALQHNALTWQVLGPSFVRAEGLSRSSRQVDKTFHTLLLELAPEQRRQLIDDVFSVGRELGIRTLTELVSESNRREALRALSLRLAGLEKDVRESLFRALRSPFRLEDDEELL